MSAGPPRDKPAPIVLIHGLWMTSRCWEHWVERYRGQGHEVIARGWPGVEGEVEDLRRDPSPLAGLGVSEIVDHYERIIRGLPEPPIIIGHSFGGLFTQLLLDRGLGAAGVAIAPAAPKGVYLLPWSTLRSAWPALRNPANRRGVVPLTLAQFRYRFTNGLGEERSQAVHDRYYIPGSGRLLFQAALANLTPRATTAIDFAASTRAPLLLVSGGRDHISPPALVRAVAKRQREAPAITDYREFPGRTHYTLGERGWEAVADHALDWSVEQASAVTAPPSPETAA